MKLGPGGLALSCSTRLDHMQAWDLQLSDKRENNNLTTPEQEGGDGSELPASGAAASPSGSIDPQRCGHDAEAWHGNTRNIMPYP